MPHLRTLVLGALLLAPPVLVAQDRQTDNNAFTLNERVPAGQWIRVRNVNGALAIVRCRGVKVADQRGKLPFERRANLIGHASGQRLDAVFGVIHLNRLSAVRVRNFRQSRRIIEARIRRSQYTGRPATATKSII